MIDMKTKWISVVTFSVAPDDLPTFANKTVQIMQRTAPVQAGFVEGAVMSNQAHTQLIVVAQWASRESWAAAQWDQDLTSAIAPLIESAKSFEFHAYEPITVVRAP